MPSVSDATFESRRFTDHHHSHHKTKGSPADICPSTWQSPRAHKLKACCAVESGPFSSRRESRATGTGMLRNGCRQSIPLLGRGVPVPGMPPDRKDVQLGGRCRGNVSTQRTASLRPGWGSRLGRLVCWFGCTGPGVVGCWVTESMEGRSTFLVNNGKGS